MIGNYTVYLTTPTPSGPGGTFDSSDGHGVPQIRGSLVPPSKNGLRMLIRGVPSSLSNSNRSGSFVSMRRMPNCIAVARCVASSGLKWCRLTRSRAPAAIGESTCTGITYWRPKNSRILSSASLSEYPVRKAVSIIANTDTTISTSRRFAAAMIWLYCSWNSVYPARYPITIQESQSRLAGGRTILYPRSDCTKASGSRAASASGIEPKVASGNSGSGVASRTLTISRILRGTPLRK